MTKSLQSSDMTSVNVQRMTIRRISIQILASVIYGSPFSIEYSKRSAFPSLLRFANLIEELIML